MTEAHAPKFDFHYVLDDGETQTARRRHCSWDNFVEWLDEMAERDLVVTDICCPVERPYSHHTIGTVDIGHVLKDALLADCIEHGVSIREWVTQAVRAKLGVKPPGSLGDHVDSDPTYGVGRSQGHRVVLGKFQTPAAARAAEERWYRLREGRRDEETARKAAR